MSSKFIGQIMMAGFDFAPRFSAHCNGQLLPINQNQALFSLLGTQYGGNGTTNFALPDLRGRTPIGFASSVDPGWQPPSVQIGQSGGLESVTLLSSNLPAHGHSVNATSDAGTTRNPGNGYYASASLPLHGPASSGLVPLNPTTVAPVGGSQSHANMQPYLTSNFCIFLQGLFPSRN
ncbi:phage tail protein [Arenimonas alkanexedens]